MKVFRQFINSPEYQRGRFGRLPLAYNVYKRSQPKFRTWHYFAGKQKVPDCFFVEGPHSQGVAVALVGYFETFERNW